MKLKPVDYDPFAESTEQPSRPAATQPQNRTAPNKPRLKPVDHDPFAQTQQPAAKTPRKQPKLKPVNFNPFEQTAGAGEAVAQPPPSGGGGVMDTAQRSYADAASGVGSGIEAAGEAMGFEGAQNLGRSMQSYWGDVSGEAEEAGGVSVPDTLKGGYADVASGLGSILDYAGNRFGSRGLSTTGESMKAYWDRVAKESPMSETAQVSPYDDPKVLANPNWWIENTTRMAPSFALPAGAGGAGFKLASGALPGLPKIAAAFGAGVGGLFGGGLEGAQTYEEGLEMGQEEPTAARAGEAMALGSGILNAIPFYKILNPGARGVVRRFMAAGMSEGITEAAEEPLDAVIQGLVYDKETDWEDVVRSMLHVMPPAFLLGGVAGAGSPSAQAPETGAPTPETPPIAPQTPSARPGGELSPALEQDETALTGQPEEPSAPVEDVSLVGESPEEALADRMTREFPEETLEPGGPAPDAPAPGSVQDESMGLSEPLPTADVVAMAPDEEITMEGPADPDLADFMERQQAGVPPQPPQQPATAPELAPDAQVPPQGQIAPVSESAEPAVTQEPSSPVEVTSSEQLNEVAQQAATSPENALTEPTEGQKSAGNYRKPKIRLSGHEISIENPKGSTRSGTDRTGREWSQKLKDHYGYLRGVKGRDKDNLDVFLTDQAHDTTRPVFVVDQIDPATGRYDEAKAIMGATNEKQARRVYQRNYEKGWKGLGAITQMTQDQFKEWTKGDTTKPVALEQGRETPGPRESEATPARTPAAARTTPAQESPTDQPAPARQADEGEATQAEETATAPEKPTTPKKKAKKKAAKQSTESKRESAKKADTKADQGTAMFSEDTVSVKDAEQRIRSRHALDTFSLSERDGSIVLNNMVATEKGEGSGTAAMQDLVDYADQTGRRIILTPGQRGDGTGTTSTARLKRFYKRFGFVENKGRNKDFSVSEGMYREPQTPMFATAYHGSPHKFDRFDLSRIGTGEGGQAFGYGIYIAENPEVANTYRLAGQPPYLGSQAYEYASTAAKRTKNRSEALDYLNAQMLEARDAGNSFDFGMYRDAINNYDELLSDRLGHSYTVDIPDSAVAKMLDWDKPLSKQAKNVREAFRDLDPQMTGQDLYSYVTGQIGREAGLGAASDPRSYQALYPQASQRLNEMGIPGIKYLDQGSRAQGEGTRNFVIFDDSLITILERNGEPVTGAERDQALASMRGETTAGMSVTDATNSLRQIVGKKGVHKLFRSGRFNILPDQRALEEVVGERAESGGRVKGMYDPASKKSYLVAGNIRPDELTGVFLHEVGAHYGLPRMIGKGEYFKIKKQLQRLYAQEDPWVVAAYNRVPKNTPQQYWWDEVLAYTVEQNHQMPALRRMWSKMKAFLKELGVLHAMDMSSADMVELVRGAAAHAVRTAPRSPTPSVQDGTQPTMASKRRVNKDKLRNMGMDFENLPGDEQGSQTRATEPVDQEPDTVDTDAAREQLRKRGYEGGPMFSVDSDQQDRGTIAHMITGEEKVTFHPATQQQNKLKRYLKRYFTKEGLLTDEAFARHVESMGIKNEDELVTQFMVDGMVKAARRAYKKPWMKVSERDKAQMNEYLAGNNQADVPVAVKRELDNMRTSLDAQSGRVQEMLIDEIMYRLHALKPAERQKAMALIQQRDAPFEQQAELSERMGEIDKQIASLKAQYTRAINKQAPQSRVRDIQGQMTDLRTERRQLEEQDPFSGVDPIVVRKLMMYRTIEGNKRQYLNRSYAVFDNDKWVDEVAGDVKERARQYLMQQVEGSPALSQMSDQAKADYVEGLMNKLLQPRARDLMSFMNSSQLGQKDLSVLKRRKDIAPEIRELMGEYKDPRVNYARSMGKMSYLVANHHFLRSVREDGLGVFLSSRPSGRMSEEITSWDQNQMAPLAGLYAPPEFAAALREAAEPAAMQAWMRNYMLYFNVPVKFGKTVFSPTTMARNFLSASMFTVMNGHFNYTHFLKAGSHTWADLGSSNPAKMDYLRRMVRLGVLHDNPRARELKEALDDALDMNALEGSLPARGVKTILNTATKMYRAGDDFWKIIGFENTKADLMRAGMPESEAEVMAADRVRNGYPTYSMVPGAIRGLRRFPVVGTFVSFPWEILRNTRHQFRFLREDWNAGRTNMVGKRAVGMAIAGGIAHGISMATMAYFGLDDEDDEAIRQMAPEWQQNAQLAYLPPNEDGQMRYLDLSHLDPYTYLKIPFNALANGNYESLDEAAIAGMQEFLEPFLGSEIGFKALGQVWFNSTEYGPVYDENAHWSIRGKQIVWDHLRKELQPGLFSNVERTIKAWKDIYTSYGKKYELSDELLAWGGLRISTMEPEISLRFRSFEFNDQKSGANRPTYRAFRDPNIGAYEDIPGAVEQSKAQWREAFKGMHASIRAARKIGMDDGEIVMALKEGGIAGKYIGPLMGGHVPPWRPYEPTLSNARASLLKTRDDPAEKKALMQDFQKRRELLHQSLSQ